MAVGVRVKRGLKADIDANTPFPAGELLFATDENVLYVSDGSNLHSWGSGAVVSIDDLSDATLSSVSEGDLLIADSDGEFVNEALKLTSDTTVNVDDSMSASEIQAAIDAVPRNLGGYTLTIQFADGTYTIDQGISVFGFYGGAVNAYGDASEGQNLHTDQSVTLDGSGLSDNVLTLISNAAPVVVECLHIKGNSAANYRCLFATDTMPVAVFGSYLEGNGTGSGWGFQQIRVAASKLHTSYVSNVKDGYHVHQASVGFANDVDDTGTQPAYGLTASSGSQMGTAGTTPTGSTANTRTYFGGEIL